MFLKIILRITIDCRQGQIVDSVGVVLLVDINSVELYCISLVLK